MQRTSEPSQRQLRVGEQLRHMIAEVLQKGSFRDPILFDAVQNITVTEVRVSPDLKHGTAYVMMLGGGEMGDVLPALNDAATYFQHEIGKNLELRFTPKLRFVFDDSYQKAERIERLLKDISGSKQ